MTKDAPRIGELGVNSWAGLIWTKVEIVGETPKRFRVRMLKETKIPGSVLQAGDEALVPKTAIRFREVA